MVRLIQILFIAHRNGLSKYLVDNKASFCKVFYIWLFLLLPIKKELRTAGFGLKLRVTLEELGPFYIKLGQILSIRPDIFNDDVISELSGLQSNVKQFPWSKANEIILNAYNRPIRDIFVEFNETPIAAGSISQVYKARLLNGKAFVAIKVKRPNIEKDINTDIILLRKVAILLEALSKTARYYKIKQIINEIEYRLHLELDFYKEIVNTQELARMHRDNGDRNVVFPKIYAEISNQSILVMEWIDAIPIDDDNALTVNKINRKQLAETGLNTFFTQVFNFGVFHADMHPGNIMCNSKQQFILLDCGLVGRLSEIDKKIIAMIFLSFFDRNYSGFVRAVEDSGWATQKIDANKLEERIRYICEPSFNKQMDEISLAQILVNILKELRLFNVQIPPQLILLQKTIINVEGLGKLIDPTLNIWEKSTPFLSKWVANQIGIRGFIKHLKSEIPYWSYIIPNMLRSHHESVVSNKTKLIEIEHNLSNINKSIKTLLWLFCSLLITFIIFELLKITPPFEL